MMLLPEAAFPVFSILFEFTRAGNDGGTKARLPAAVEDFRNCLLEVVLTDLLIG